MEISFENAKRSDLPKIVEIYNSTIPSQLATADMKPVSVDERKLWFSQHKKNSSPIWLVKDIDKLTVGWVSFQPFYGREAYRNTFELSIYLSATTRHKGVGKIVLAHCIKEAPKFQIKTLLAFIFGHNEASLQLFSNFGFQKWGHLPKIADFNEVERDLIILGKRIA